MDKDILNIIKRYLDKPGVDYGLLLTGEWGCGKTYYVKNNLTKENGIDRKPVYISFQELSSADQIVSLVTNQICFAESKSVKAVEKFIECGFILKK